MPTVLLVVLIVVLLAVLPTWPYSTWLGLLSQRWSGSRRCDRHNPAGDGTNIALSWLAEVRAVTARCLSGCQLVRADILDVSERQARREIFRATHHEC